MAGHRRHDSIRTSLDLISERILACARTVKAGDKGIVVLVTAGSRGEGVTSVIMGLGTAFGTRLMCKTLVIDHDPGPTGVARRLGLVATVVDVGRLGVPADVLSRVDRLEEDGFDLLTLALDYAPTFGDSAREALLWEVRPAYDVILVDARSLQSHAALVWGRHVDQVILVVDTTITTAAMLERLKATLQQAGQPLTGVILNKRQLPVPDVLYRRLR
jgi:Mrp family chromosome partitioning ATPase